MCQLTSPSLKMVCELPSTAERSRTPTSTGRNNLPGLLAFAASVIGSLAGSATASAMGTPPLRRPAAVDEIEHDPDRLRGEEENLGTVRQANEQIKAAENS